MADQTDYVKTALRLPRNLHGEIHRVAEEAGRSFNAEIIARLQESFISPAARNDSDALIEKMLERLAPAVAELLAAEAKKPTE